MNYYKLAVKMFKKRSVQYRLFWLSQMIVVSLFFLVYSFYRTDDFMNHFAVISQQIVDSTQIGMVGTMAFTACFIPFSHWLLFQRRTRDFATLLSVGLSRSMMYVQIFIEHVFLDVTAAACGFLIGTIGVALSYFGIVDGLGLKPLNLPISKMGYFDAAKIVLIIDGISILGILIICSFQSIKQIEGLNQRRIKKFRLPHVAFSFIIKKFRKRKNSEDIYTYNRRYQIWKDSRFLQFANIIMIILFFFMMILSVVNARWIDDNGKQMYPFDLVYVNEYTNLKDEKQYSDKDLIKIMEKNNVKPKVFTEIDYYRNGAFNLFDVSDINEICGTKYKVKRGTALEVQRETKGYWEWGITHREKDSSVSVPLKSGLKSFNIPNQDINMLFGYPCMADRIVLLNSKDFNNLGEEIGDYLFQKNYLMSFSKWQDSKPIVESMKKYLGDDSYRAIYSRYLYEEQSTQNQIFEVILFSLIGFSLYGGSLLCIHFWMKIRRDEQLQEYKKLWDVGMNKETLQKVRKQSVHILFWPPYIFGMIVGIIISCVFSGGTLFLLYAIKASVIFAAIFTAMHLLVEKVYIKKTIN